MAEVVPLYAEVPRAPVEREQGLACNPQCGRCVLGAREVKHRCLAPEDAVSGTGGLLVVGDYPSRHEDGIGRPFSSAVGAWIRGEIKKYWRGAVAFDYAVKCAPGSDAKEAGVDNAVAACRGYLAQTVRDVRPAKVLALGRYAARSLLDQNINPLSVRRGYGWLADPVMDGRPVPVYFFHNPAPLLGNRFWKRTLESDLRWALENDVPFKPAWKSVARVVRTNDDAVQAVNEMRRAPWFAYDVETAGVLFRRFQIVSAAVCSAVSEDAWVWDHRSLAAPELREALKEVLVHGKVVGSNVKFDELATKHELGVEIKNVVGDTRLLRKTLDADVAADLATMADLVGMGGHKNEAKEALEKARRAVVALAQRNTSPQVDLLPPEHGVLRPDVAKSIRKGDDTAAYAYALIPNDVRTRYVARDVVSTSRLNTLLHNWAGNDDPALMRTYRNIVMPAAQAIRQIEWWGVGVSIDNIKAFQVAMAFKKQEILSRLHRYGNFNPEAHGEVSELLFGKLGLQPIKKTKLGWSTDADVLEQMKHQHPVVPDLLAFREVAKMDSTYATGLERHIRDDQRIHPSFLLDGTRTGRLSSADPNCFDPTTEVLTRGGWVAFRDYKPGEPVAQYHPSGAISFVEPTGYVRRQHTGSMIALSATHINLLMTPDHRCLLRNRKTKELQVFTADAYPKDWEQVTAGWGDGGSFEMPADMVTVVCAAQADGSWVKGEKPVLDFGFTKERKAARLKAALESLQATFTYTVSERGRHRFYVRGTVAEYTHLLLGEKKQFGDWVLNLDRASLSRFAAEIFQWDGCATRQSHYTTVNPVNANYVQAALVLSGLRARLRTRPGTVKNGRLQYIVDVTSTDCTSTSAAYKARVPYAGLVYCVEVPTGFIVVRRDGVVAITGNCQNIPRESGSDAGRMARDVFAAPEGHILLQFDYSQLELRIAAMLSGDPVMRAIFERGEDLHQATAKLIAPLVWKISPDKVGKKERSEAKAFNFGILYGMGDRAIAHNAGCTVEQAAQIRAAVLGRFTKLADMVHDRHAFAKKHGFCWTWWDGDKARRRPLFDLGSQDEGERTTAENGAFNTPIQGTGSEYMVRSLTEVVRWILADAVPAKAVLTVHDSLLVEAREDCVDEVIYQVHRIMTGWNSLGVPLVVDVEKGYTWGGLKKVSLVA